MALIDNNDSTKFYMTCRNLHTGWRICVTNWGVSYDAHTIMHVHYYNESYLPYTSNYQWIQNEQACLLGNTWQFIWILPGRNIQLFPPYWYSLALKFHDMLQYKIAVAVLIFLCHLGKLRIVYLSAGKFYCIIPKLELMQWVGWWIKQLPGGSLLVIFVSSTIIPEHFV